MVLTKEELIASLQHEVRILVHLAGKVDKSKLDYRPTPKQRSTLELLQYMAIMGPTQVAVIKTGVFDRAALSAAWSPAEAAATEIDVFGPKFTRGWLLVNQVLSGFAAYRMQRFLYLKACGREELDTMNLWAGA